jgi:hypothetical protein
MTEVSMFLLSCPFPQSSSRSHRDLHAIVKYGSDTGQYKVLERHRIFIQHTLGIEAIAFHHFPVLVCRVVKLIPASQRMFYFGLEKIFQITTP